MTVVRSAARQLPAPALAITAVLSVASAGLVVRRPAFALLGPLLALLFLAAARVERRHAVVALLVYLPFQDLVLSRVDGNAQLLARYGPELAVYLIVAPLLVTRFTLIRERLGKLALPLVALVVFWIGTGVWNAVSATTIAIGFRSELRFLPLIVVPLVSATVARDVRVYARTLIFVATFEALLAVVQFVGGPAVRAPFAPSYDISLQGLSVGRVGPPLDTIFGTFPHRNDLGVFLAFAWILLAAAGSRQLGFSRRTGLAIGWLLALGTYVSASREGGIALLIAAIVIARARFHWPLLRLCALGAVAAVAAAAMITPAGSANTYLHPSSLVQRWAVIFTPAAWSATYETNFRLFYLAANAGLVAAEAPVAGFGLGVVSDPRGVEDLSSPIFRTYAGQKAAEFGWYWDGNWALLLLEVGFGGLAMLGVLFMTLISVARRLEHWVGIALICIVFGIAALGFFAATFQQRLPTAILWLLAGTTAALVSRTPADARG